MKTHVLFLHGRPSAHPIHEAYGKSVSCQSSYIDPAYRWHDKKIGSVKRYLYYILNAIHILKKYSQTIILSEGFHFTPILIKALSLGKRRVFYLLDDEGLYFRKSHYYSSLTRKLMSWSLSFSDGAVCIGKFQADLYREICKKPFVTSWNGVEDSRLKDLLASYPELNCQKIVTIANGPGSERIWYKGLDLMISSLDELLEQLPNIKLTIIGEWNEEDIKSLLHQTKHPERFAFIGKVTDLTAHLQNASLYLHTARGEAWGISVVEAMAAGLPTLVSDVTGAKEVVEQVDTNLITSLKKEDIKNRLIWYFSLNLESKKKLSTVAKSTAQTYKKSVSIEKFRKSFNQLIETKPKN